MKFTVSTGSISALSSVDCSGFKSPSGRSPYSSGRFFITLVIGKANAKIIMPKLNAVFCQPNEVIDKAKIGTISPPTLFPDMPMAVARALRLVNQLLMRLINGMNPPSPAPVKIIRNAT